MQESPCGVEGVVEALVNRLQTKRLPEGFQFEGEEWGLILAGRRHGATNYDELGTLLSKHCYDCDTHIKNERCTHDPEDSECDYEMSARCRLRCAANDMVR